jgi:hypothetical protein
MNDIETKIAGYGILTVIIILCGIQCLSIYKCTVVRKYEDYETI